MIFLLHEAKLHEPSTSVFGKLISQKKKEEREDSKEYSFEDYKTIVTNDWILGFKEAMNGQITSLVTENEINIRMKRFVDTLILKTQIALLETLGRKIEDEIDADKHYTKEIFPEISKLQLEQINNMLQTNQGFTLDRLSAHISRLILNELKSSLAEIDLEEKWKTLTNSARE